MSLKPAERPDGGVVTQRTANPRSFGPNPHISAISAILSTTRFRRSQAGVRKICARFTRLAEGSQS